MWRIFPIQRFIWLIKLHYSFSWERLALVYHSDSSQFQWLYTCAISFTNVKLNTTVMQTTTATLQKLFKKSFCLCHTNENQTVNVVETAHVSVKVPKFSAAL